jgi:beta-lactamase regulating signal transducer with metallopeptidase domain
MTHEILALLWRSTLTTSMAICVVLALRLPLRRWLGAQAAYLAWTLVPLAAVAALLPAPLRPMAIMHSFVLPAPQAIVAPVAANASAATATAMANVHAAFDPTVLLVLGWLIGMLAMLLFLVQQQRRYLKNLGALSKADAGTWHAQNADTSPALIGAWRPRVVLPGDFESHYTPRERELVLAHERMHLVRGDAQINALVAALRCLQWFNPLLHLAASRLRFDQELACDVAVISRFPEARRPYADAMLKVQLAGEARQELRLPVGCHWPSGHPLKERIRMLKQPVPARERRAFGAAIALMLSAGGSYLAWAAQPAAEADNLADQRIEVSNVKLTVDGASVIDDGPSGIIFRAGDPPAAMSGGDETGHPILVEFVAKPLADGRIEVSARVKRDNGPAAQPELLATLPTVIATSGQPMHVESSKELSGHDIQLDALVSAHAADFRCEESIGETLGHELFAITFSEPLAQDWIATGERVSIGAVFLSQGNPAEFFRGYGPARDVIKVDLKPGSQGEFEIASTWLRAGIVEQTSTTRVRQNAPAQIKLADPSGGPAFELSYTLTKTKAEDLIPKECQAVAEKFPVVRISSNPKNLHVIVVRALIDTNGRVQDAALAGVFPFQSKPRPIDQQALDAVKNHQFAPIAKGDQPTWVLVPVPVDFHGPNGLEIDISG